MLVHVIGAKQKMLVTLLCYCWMFALSLAAPTANVTNGTYSGLHSPNFNQDFFLGVPFAQPPVGNNRLRVPQSLNETFVNRSAKEYGPACIGYGPDTEIGASNNVSEDCLTLNIIRPTGYDDLPVGVWIYGGGFYEGSTRDPRYNLSFIVQESVNIGKPTIGVSINYRLHGWGWMWSQEIVDAGVANLGLRDQRKALEWIQENIQAFGGNPRNVTIWGESSGALSVGLHMLAYNGRDDGLFSGGIAQSGALSQIGPLNPYPELSEQAYRGILNSTNCTSLDCLRQLSTAQLNATLAPITAESLYSLAFGPLVDGDIIARGSIEQVLEGAYVKVPYLLGQNDADGTDFISFGINNDTAFRQFFSGFNFSNAALDRLMELYPSNASRNSLSYIPTSAPYSFNSTIGRQFKRAATLIGDLFFKAPTRFSLHAYTNISNSSAQEDAPVYTYRFDTIPNGVPDYFGATHFTEVAFVFHNVDNDGYAYPSSEEEPYFGKGPFANRPQSFKTLSTLMSRMWASFIYDGNPNYATSAGNLSLPSGDVPSVWPRYTKDEPIRYVFNANVTDTLGFLEYDDERVEQMNYIIQQFTRKGGVWQEWDNS